MIGKISFYTSAVGSINGDDVRISRRVQLPNNKLRGFQKGKIGPLDGLDYVGGNYASALNFQTTLPQIFPSFQSADFSYYIDMANVWGVDYDQSINKSNKIRSSTGISVDLLTPVGPLNFSFSQPLSKASTDKTEKFRFNLGTTF
jgi:outer membrane protein insertion porin family